MLNLCVISDEISQDPERVVQVCKEYGVSMIEPRSVWDTAPAELSSQQIDSLKSILQESAFTVPCIASPFLKCDLGDPQQYQEQIQILRNCINLARQTGCQIIRGFTFWKTGPAQDVWQQLLDAYAEPIRICEEEDMYIGIENESSTHIATAAEAQQMYKELGSHRIQAIWDPANEVYAEDGELPFPNAWERMKPNTIHVHIKDAVKDPDTEGGARCVPVGDGGYIDYPGQFQALVDMQYEGACSLETHWRPSAEIEGDLLNLPGGAAFSEGGEAASRICFQKILSIIDGLECR